VRRFLGLLLLTVFAASLNFGQVAPITHGKGKAKPTPTPQVVNATQNGDATGDPENSQPPSLVAQAPGTRAGAPQRPAPSVPPAVSSQPAPANPPESQQTVRLQFPNSDVQDVLRFYESLTGKKLIMDNFVNGKVNIFLSKDVPRDEAIKIIEISLLLNGVSLIPAEGDIVKVIGTGKNPRTTGVPIISDESEIPEGDHVISYLFKLRYADPQELLQALGQYLSPPQPYTSFLALPKASAILVTENSSVIRTLAKIIDQVDQPPAEVVSEFIKLERADVSKVVDMLKDVFEKTDKTTSQPGQPGYRPGVRPVNNPNAPVPPANVEPGEVAGLTALTEESVIVGKIKLEADVRTNRIHVITRPVNMPFVRKLISEFDANVEFAKPVTRPLRYISAADVLPVIVQALTEPGQAGGGAGQEGAQGGVPGASPPGQKRTTTSTAAGGYASSTSSTSGTGGGESTLNVSEELQTQPVDTTPKSVTVGNAKIIADQRANSIITLGNQEVVVKVQKILDEMDVKAPQVALSTVIGELSLTNDEELGVDWFAKYDQKIVGISRNTNVTIPNPLSSATPAPGGTPIIGAGSIVDPAGLVNFGNALASVASGTNVFISAGNYLATIVHVLESTGKFQVISRPMVFTSNNKKAIIASGQEVPIPVNTLSNVVNTGTTTNNGTAAVASNIEYKKVALQLEVVPLINSEKEVSLDILQKIDSLVAGGNVNIGGNTVPTIATRYIRTNITAQNGSTIVLGGLIQDNKQKTYGGIPILDKIPYLGAAFRSTTYTRTRSELIVLMCPEVTLTQLDLVRLREKVEDHTHFGPEIDQGYCPDCPPSGIQEKQLDKQLPPPDLPFGKEPIKAH
jgi:type II secretion system protein D